MACVPIPFVQILKYQLLGHRGAHGVINTDKCSIQQYLRVPLCSRINIILRLHLIIAIYARVYVMYLRRLIRQFNKKKKFIGQNRSLTLSTLNPCLVAFDKVISHCNIIIIIQPNYIVHD